MIREGCCKDRKDLFLQARTSRFLMSILYYHRRMFLN